MHAGAGEFRRTRSGAAAMPAALHVRTGALRDYCSPACAQLLTLCPRTQDSQAHLTPSIIISTGERMWLCVEGCAAGNVGDGNLFGWLCGPWWASSRKSLFAAGVGVGQMTMDDRRGFEGRSRHQTQARALGCVAGT